VAYSYGARVVLITTVNTKKPYGVINVKSAEDMKSAVENEFDDANCIIMAAAVADYRAKNISTSKLKKSEDVDTISIELIKNPDILRCLCEKKSKVLSGSVRSANYKENTPIIVGFCAESENLLENAKTKIAKKGCDYLVANDISRKDIGFSSDYNEVSILSKDGGIIHLDRMKKNEIAKNILRHIYG
jgi:phosphopantothenoylcysteine decarboxylase/phosphopantothenate--cysteine ligase